MQNYKIEDAQNYEKKQLQNKTIESLLGPENPIEQIESKHINFFEDYAPNIATNEDYRIEKEKLDMTKLKKEGIAPWAFGDGSQEKSKQKAWYETITPAPNSYDTINSSQTAPAPLKRKQLEHKQFSDPMRKIVKHEQDDSNAAYIHNNNSINHQNFSDDKDKKLLISLHKTLLEKDIVKYNKDNKQVLDTELLIALRKKRLEREKIEHKKEQLLLATNDIYGNIHHTTANSRCDNLNNMPSNSKYNNKVYNNMYQK